MTLALLFVFAYWIPGRLLQEYLVPSAEPEERLPIAIGLGLVFVNTTTFILVGILGLFLPFYISREVVLTISLLYTVILGVLCFRNQASWFHKPNPHQFVMLTFTAVCFSFYIVHYDSDLLWEEACMVRAASATVGDTLKPELISLVTGAEPLSTYQTDPISGQVPGNNRFILHNQGERAGPTVLIGPFLALFGYAGFRLIYALSGLLLPGLGFVIGKRLLGRNAFGWVTAVLLVFSPYLLESRTFDENFMACCFGTMVIALLIRPQPSLFASGAVMALFIGIRHEMLPAVIFTIFYIRALQGKYAIRSFISGFALLSLPYLIIHLASFISDGMWYEGAFQRPLAPHSLFGLDFEFPVQLSFPFMPEPVRSPYQAYPTLVEIPLDLIRRYGLALSSLISGGIIWLFRNRRREASLLISWVLWLLALLMVQSNFVEPNKMGIPATVLVGITVFLVAGLAFLFDIQFSVLCRCLVVITSGFLLLGFTYIIKDYKAPLDERTFGLKVLEYDKLFGPDMVRFEAETPAYIEFDRKQLSAGLLPKPENLDLVTELLASSIKRAMFELTYPWMQYYERPMPDRLDLTVRGTGYTVAPLTILSKLEGASSNTPPPMVVQELAELTLDLTEPPLLSANPLKGDADAPIMTLDGSDAYLITQVEVPWSTHRLNIAAARDRFGTVFLVFVHGPRGHVSPVWPVRPKLIESLPLLALRLRVPEGTPVRLIEVRSYRPARWYSRWIIIRDKQVWISDPVAISPA